ncbi:MAG: diacylglycerol kinase [Planctomycetales bacterium]|nr:diacylglycerol kinase [Planctomycetales bacterium]
MPASPPTPHTSLLHEDRHVPHRAAWRQQLVDAERGFVRGVRSDSSFFVHFFGGSIVLAMGFVLHVGTLDWIIITFCLTLVLMAELFNHALRTMLLAGDADHESSAVRRALGMSTAAVMAAVAGSLVILTIIFGGHLRELLGS